MKDYVRSDTSTNCKIVESVNQKYFIYQCMDNYAYTSICAVILEVLILLQASLTLQ